jgi:hypothetical protein
MNLLLKLLIAHLVGDFLLQPTAWVKNKEEKKLAAWQLYVHSILHGALVLLFFWTWQAWKYALLITVIHFIIDSWKLIFQNKHNRRLLFFMDQAFHFISIYLIWLWLEEKPFPLFIFGTETFLFFITGIIFLTNPVSFGVKIFISKWTPEPQGQSNDSLQSAGKYIGIFERLLVFIFIIIHQWAAIGFLLAAKSVFRFGDLKEAKDRKLTEYVLIGTLLSFGTAILIGLIFNYTLGLPV